MQQQNFILLLIVCSTLHGYLCSYVAAKKGKNQRLWFMMGVLFGLLGLLMLALLPKKEKTLETVEKEPPADTPQFITACPTQIKKFWYYLDEKQTQCGPMSFDALTKAWEKGDLDTQTFVWNEEFDQWKRLGEAVTQVTTP